METTRPLPPLWVMGLGFLPLGVFGSVMLITVPELLAADHVPEPQIAMATAIGLTPGFLSIAVAPLLDWRFSRRVYAIGLALAGAILNFLSLMAIRNVELLTLFLFLGNMAISLCVSAVGGWFGNLVPTEDKGRLGAWFTVANIGGGGAVAAAAIFLLRALPYEIGAIIISVLVIAVLPLFFLTPCPPADGRLASESFRDFVRDVLALLRMPIVLWTLLLFLMPSASFALTNTLGGFGRDFHTSEQLVGLLGGVGSTVAGVVGSLLMPPLANRVEPRGLYLMVGTVGAAFTLALTLIPHTPASFGLAMLGENVFQAAAFATAYAIILRTIGHENPLASTQFGLLLGASVVPLSYMQVIDGHAYGFGGVNGSYLADALISGGVCLALAALFWALRRSIPSVDAYRASPPLL